MCAKWLHGMAKSASKSSTYLLLRLHQGKREKMQGSWILDLFFAFDTFTILRNNNEQVLFLLKQPEAFLF
jgi:hypothetical protein